MEKSQKCKDVFGCLIQKRMYSLCTENEALDEAAGKERVPSPPPPLGENSDGWPAPLMLPVCTESIT